MGIMWGEVASSALERIGENVSADLERARARRQAIIDASVQDMFTSGKEAFAKRQLEREGIQDNIKYFQSMGFDRDTIEQLVSLSSTEIDKLKLSLEEGRKEALYEKKEEFDQYAAIGLPDPNDRKHSVPLSVNFAKNMSKEEQISAMSNIPPKERKRLFEKAKELGVEVPDFSATIPSSSTEEFTEHFTRNTDLSVQAMLAAQRMEQVEESEKTNYKDWEDSVLANIIGKIDHTKFPDSKAEKSFGDNFRTSLRDSFGWAGGEQEEALRQAALLFPGKSAAELRSVLDPTLYERPETIVPPEYAIGYTKAEELEIKRTELLIGKAEIELENAEAEKVQENTLMGTLMGNYTLYGEKVPDDMTYRMYRVEKDREIQAGQAMIQQRRLRQMDMIPMAVQNKLRGVASNSVSNMTGAKMDPDALSLGVYMFEDTYLEAKNLSEKSLNLAMKVTEGFTYQGPVDVPSLSSMVTAASDDIAQYLIYKRLLDVAEGSTTEDRNRNVKSLIQEDFSTITGTWSEEGTALAFVSHIQGNAVAKRTLKRNIDKIIELHTNSSEQDDIAINEILNGIRQNAKEGALEPNYFERIGEQPADAEAEAAAAKAKAEAEAAAAEADVDAEAIENWTQINEKTIDNLLTNGVFGVSEEIEKDVALSNFIRGKGIDLGDLQIHLDELNSQGVTLNRETILRRIKQFVDQNKKD